MNIISDGDSSVFARVWEEVPILRRNVEKLECANHTCKYFGSNLEKLVADNPQNKGYHKLPKYMRQRSISAVRCAIKKQLGEKDKHTAIKKLKHDIVESVQHCFDNHEKCSADFCKAKTSANETHVESTTNHSSSTVPEVILEQDEIWKKITMKICLKYPVLNLVSQ